jgi:hypothetical protein
VNNFIARKVVQAVVANDVHDWPACITTLVTDAISAAIHTNTVQVAIKESSSAQRAVESAANPL